MKKLFTCLICVCVMLCSVGFIACGRTYDEDAVNLVAVDANAVGLAHDIDYYLVAEPAASAKVKVIPNLNFAGSLQQLYGGNGYPQAVVVAKNGLLGSDALTDFIDALSTSREWLLSEDVSIEHITDTINSHLTQGMEPAIKPQNLTKQVIENCGINFVQATAGKADIISFMEKLNSVGGGSFGMPAEDFFWDGGNSGEYTEKISVYAPDGAPALGIAKAMSENNVLNAEYFIVNPNTVQALVGGAEPKADICVLPVNVAVKLLGNAKNYKLVGTLTHGNLYLLSKSGEQISADNIEKIKGSTVGVVNLAAVPGLTFKVILQSHGIGFKEQ